MQQGENKKVLSVANGNKAVGVVPRSRSTTPSRQSFNMVALAFTLFLLSSSALAEPRPTYLCTSRQYSLSFGSSLPCPNIEDKTRKELWRYLRFAYRNLGGIREARAAYVTFRCSYVSLPLQ